MECDRVKAPESRALIARNVLAGPTVPERKGQRMNNEKNISAWEIVGFLIAAILFFPILLVLANRILYWLHLLDVAAKSS